MRKLILLAVISLMCLLVACTPTTGTDAPASAVSTVEVALTVSTATPPPPVATATTDAPPTVVTEPTQLPVAETAFATAALATFTPDATITYGRTDDGAFFHGAADAPVTLIDYSDFL